MYKIILNGTDVIQDSVNNVVINPVLTEKSNSAGTLAYSIPYNDEHYNEYQELVTTVQVFNDDNTTPEFSGRLLSSDKTFDGMLKLTFEGDLALLNDVQYPPYDYTGSVKTFFTNVLTYYNSKASSNHQINLGTVTVEDPNEYIVRSNEDYSSCWEVINTKLVGMLGGYLYISYVRLKDGSYSRYLNYVTNCGKCSQAIEFGKNLLDLEHYIDATNVATRLIALGAESDEEGYTQPTYTVDTELESTYGIIELVNKWDDVTEQANLESKAKEYAKSMVLRDVTINAKAIDLHFTDTELEEFRVNKTITCKSTPHNVEANFILTERTRNLNNPVQDSFSLGSEQKTLTASITNRTIYVDEKTSKTRIEGIVDSQTSIILGGSGGYLYFAKDEDGVVHEIYFMDSADKSTAKKVLRMNNQGIGFSTTGINGPFGSAWTIDGTFNANYIKTGTLSCDRLNGGTINGQTIKGGSILGTSISGESISGGTIRGASISGGSVSGSSISGGSISGSAISGGSLAINNMHTNGVGAWIWPGCGISGLGQLLTGYSSYYLRQHYVRGVTADMSQGDIAAHLASYDITQAGALEANAYNLFGLNSDNVTRVGNGSLKTHIYGASITSGQTIQVSSDRNLKKEIEAIDDDHLAFYDKLEPVMFKYILGTSDRHHMGFIAQDVEQALKDVGLENHNFAGICIDKTYTESEDVKDDDTNPYIYLGKKGIDKIYTLRYEEFVALNTAKIKQLEAKVLDLEQQLLELKGGNS